MNGQVLPTQPPAGPRFPPADRDDAAAARLRLLVALALSCLLHAAAVFLPYLGKTTRQARIAQSAPKVLPLVIEATLAPAGVRDFRDAAASIVARPEPPAPALAAEPVPGPPEPASQQRAEGADLLPLSAPVYYTTDQLTKRPQPLAVADLDVPQIQPLVASGKIVLKLWINEFGVVTDVDVEKTELPEVFSRTAIAAFKGLHFAPGERNGQAVPTLMRIEVNYDDSRGKPD